ncbi:MAG: SDR family oxidoreductase [Gammaproteobacteria bacterium]|nr:SDR family oxidoreductase [Gammaproteobacteria bacterium]
MSAYSLQGKVAVITGSGKNIGRATALRLAEAGCRIVVNGRSDSQAVDEVVSHIRASGGEACPVMADVSQQADVTRLIDKSVEAFGGVDIVVSNAGLRRQTPFLTMDYSEWREILSVALDGAFLLARAAAPLMVSRGGGTIIGVSGISTHVGTANRCHVSASKAGLEGLMRALAVELGPQNITCNTIAPGAIDTIRGAAAGGPSPRSLADANVPLGRKGDVEEIAAMVEYLAGPTGRYITGQTLHVNGGAYLT